MTARHERLLMVCVRCWKDAYPNEPPAVSSVHSLDDCFVCEQARGLIYVSAVIEWRAQDRARSHHS